MTIKLYAFACGWIRARMGIFLDGEEGEIRAPIPSYLIVHPKGYALFDSGLHLDIQEDAEKRMGFLTKIFKPEFSPGDEVASHLRAIEADPGRVRFLINSHLHFDHAGGNGQIPNAQLLVQAREWQAAHDPDLMQANGYNLDDYDHGHDLLLADGEHDVFGDGSVTCIPTYGHTPGHQSLKVRLQSGDVLLTGDACYLRKTLEDLHLPKVVHDREAMLASLRKIRDLQSRGARIFFGHDPVFWQTLPDAVTAMT